MTTPEAASRALMWGDECPFDARDDWQEADRRRMSDSPTIQIPAPVDWAHRAARGIVAELRDDYGGALEEAFSLEKVGEDGRVSIIETMAAIIRQAWKERSPASSVGAEN